MDMSAPLVLHRETVRPEWIDYNGHMNVAYYVLIFDHATDAFLDHVGLDADHRAAAGGSTFAVESHVTYQREVGEGEDVMVTTQLLDFDSKRIHFFHRMLHEPAGVLAATCEWLCLYVDLNTRRVAAMPSAIRANLEAVHAAHAVLDRPVEAGRTIRIPRTSPVDSKS